MAGTDSGHTPHADVTVFIWAGLSISGMPIFQWEIPLEYFICLTHRKLWKWANSLRAQMFFSCCNVISGTQSIGIFDRGQCEEIHVKASVASGQAQLVMSEWNTMSFGESKKKIHYVQTDDSNTGQFSQSFSSVAGEMVRLFIYCCHQNSSWVGGFSIKGEQRDLGLWCCILYSRGSVAHASVPTSWARCHLARPAMDIHLFLFLFPSLWLCSKWNTSVPHT